jgi:ubiquinol-cytochrome c reductase cytochrome b/c1 subunit
VSKLLKIAYEFSVKYPVPTNLTYLWNMGFLAGMCLVSQVITGVILAMHYTPQVELAFESTEHIMRDVNYGWLMRYVHSNGASMFFIVVYIHLLRGLYYGSYLYPREWLWFSGVVILLLMIVTAFMGYVLPWGQMSFRGATVITNLFSAIPGVGKELVYWIWGAFSIENATLNRFFSLHFFLPFVLVALVVVHLLLLHERGSNNPLGLNFIVDEIPFTPYFIVKDIYGLGLFLIIFGGLISFMPNALGHPDNYIGANPLVTPAHIVPEWYFSLFYTILRSVPDKLGGVISLVIAILVLILLPFLFAEGGEPRSGMFRPNRIWFWIFVINGSLLSWIGSNPVTYPYYFIGQVAMCNYIIGLMLIGSLKYQKENRCL